MSVWNDLFTQTRRSNQAVLPSSKYAERPGDKCALLPTATKIRDYSKLSDTELLILKMRISNLQFEIRNKFLSAIFPFKRMSKRDKKRIELAEIIIGDIRDEELKRAFNGEIKHTSD